MKRLVMKRLIIAAAFVGLGIGAAHAQTTPAPTPEPSTMAPVAPADAAPPTGKEVREQCKSQAIGQGLKGPARKAAVDDCFAKARPDLAKQQECRKEGKAKNLADKALRDYVKQCKTGA